MSDKLKVTLLVDNNSWILPYVKELENQIKSAGFTVSICRKAQDVPEGEVCFLLGCTRLVPPDVLKRNKHNLVVHESDLPKGRGFAPMAWQILKGFNEITVSLIEANNKADAGAIWLKDSISLNGTELCSEWRSLQGEMTIKLCMRFILEYQSLFPTDQRGESTFYPRRRPEDSELDCNKTIKEQFNLLRVVDNERYPAFFTYNGKKYRIKIFSDS